MQTSVSHYQESKQNSRCTILFYCMHFQTENKAHTFTEPCYNFYTCQISPASPLSLKCCSSRSYTASQLQKKTRTEKLTLLLTEGNEQNSACALKCPHYFTRGRNKCKNPIRLHTYASLVNK